MYGAVGYERPPLITLADILGTSGVSTVGSTTAGFALQQAAARAAGQAPTLDAAGPVIAPGIAVPRSIAIGIVVAIAAVYLIDHHVL